MPKITFLNAFVKKLEPKMHIFEILGQNLNFVLNFQNMNICHFWPKNVSKLKFFMFFKKMSQNYINMPKIVLFEAFLKKLGLNMHFGGIWGLLKKC